MNDPDTVGAMSIGEADRQAIARVLETLFPGIGADSIDGLLAIGAVITLESGTVICSPGRAIAGLTLILEGELEVEQDGRRLRGFGPNSYLGEGRLVRDTPPSVTIRATKPSRVFQIPLVECRAHLEREPALGYQLMRRILDENIDRLEAMNALYVENQRLTDALESNNDRLREMNDQLRQTMAQKVETEQRMQHLASHDALTGLPNRSMFQEFLSVALAQAERHGTRCAVHFIDLEDFKEINEIHGHTVGDGVLKAFAGRLRECIRTHDTAARVGDDEFAIAQTNVITASDITTLADRLAERMRETARIETVELPTLASVGISVYPDDSDDPAELVRNAEMALGRARAAGEAQVHFFEADMESEAKRASAVKRRLREAIEAEHLSVHYQPKVDLGSRRIVGMEALVRWNAVAAEGITTSEFISVAERTGLIGHIGELVMREACRQTQLWRDTGLGPLKVAVNVSPMQFWRQDVRGMVDNVLAETGLAADGLEIEVTEGVMLHDDSGVLATLTELRKLGITIAVDDFGTGYSSLSYLKRLSADTVKIDRAFVKDATVDAEDASICEAIIGLAKSLDLKVVAEGVEIEDHVAFFHGLGCDQGQGYLFTKPLPAPDFETFVRAWAA